MGAEPWTAGAAAGRQGPGADLDRSPVRAGRSRSPREADARIRTADPFITSEVLYQLSYVGPGAREGPRPRSLASRAPRSEVPSRGSLPGVDAGPGRGHGRCRDRERRRSIQCPACTVEPRERDEDGMHRRQQVDRAPYVTLRGNPRGILTVALQSASRSNGAPRPDDVPTMSRLPARATMRRTPYGPPRPRGRTINARTGGWPRGGDGLWTRR
jgi:hypothetical protein